MLNKEKIINECVTILNKTEVKNSIKNLFIPLIDMILKEIYPYIYLSLIFVVISFLLILGILFLKNSGEKLSLEDDQKNLNSFIQGFAISILNPKILIWFTAIFSQFIEASSTSMTKLTMVFMASSIDGIWYIIVTIVVTGFGLKQKYYLLILVASLQQRLKHRYQYR